MAKQYLRDVKFEWSKPYLALGLGLIGLSVIAANPTLVAIISAFIAMTANYLLIKSGKLVRAYVIEQAEGLTVTDKVTAVLTNKEGKIKDVREG